MVYYITHPKHGRMPVYDKSEVTRHAQWGWSLETAPAVVAEKVEPERKKPGRPPKAK